MTVSQVNALLQRFEQAAKMMKRMSTKAGMGGIPGFGGPAAGGKKGKKGKKKGSKSGNPPPRAAEARPELEAILAGLLDDAVERGVCDPGIASRDLLDSRLMGCVTPRPSEVVRTFWERYDESPEAATDYFYTLAQDTAYIRRYRLARARKWVSSTR